MRLTYKNRPIEIEISGNYEEPFAERGNYTDQQMEDLTDDELNEIQDLYAGEIGQELDEHAMESACSRLEGER